ncbi:MAG: hypothetical protein ABEH78_00270 [Haloferacaceae archaeon]
MDLEEGMVRKITVATATVVGFLVLIVLVGVTSNGAEGLDRTGALALVGSIILFIVAMAVVGFYLEE